MTEISDADKWCNHGIALSQRCLFEAAGVAFLRAIQLDRRPDFLANYGNNLTRLWRFEEARKYINEALNLNEDRSKTWCVAGIWSLATMNPYQAIARMQRAIALDPAHQLVFVKAIAHLMLGEYLTGFTEFEARMAKQKQPMVRLPIWQGENLAGKSLLVDMEQGLGDGLMCMRYVEPLIHDYDVTVRVPAPLLRFFRNQSFKAIPRVLEIGAHYRINSMSIPVVRCIDECPPPIEMNETEHVTMLGKGKFRIGICWRSKATGAESPEADYHGEQKSCPIEHFLTLAEIPGVELYSLQSGSAADDIQRCPHLVEPTLLYDMEDCAGYIHELDLVVSVDTSIAHLAGTLGKPCIIVCNVAGSWQWQLGDKTPWYPSITIVRQPSPFDWKGAFIKVRELVEKMV